METNGTTREEQLTMMAIQSIDQKMPDVELRDLFAMHALNGLVVGDWGVLELKGMARLAYTLADEMLEARRTK